MILLVITFSLLYLGGITYLFIKSRKDITKVIKFISGILFLIILNLLIWQPKFKTERIKDIDYTPTILIDNSLSMKQFNSIETITMLNSVLEEKHTLKTISFGTSVREQSFTENNFNDSTSFFPTDFFHKHKSGPILIVSDALFNNLPNEVPNPKNNLYFYTKLKRISHTDYLNIQITKKTEVISGNVFELPITFSGFSSIDKNKVNLSFYNNEKKISEDEVTIPAGNFTYKKTIKLPPLPSGRHLLKTIVNTPKSNSQHKEIIINSIPKEQTIYIDNRKPSLDIRFLKLALANNDFFKISTTKESDISIIFPQTKNDFHSKSKVNLFIGNNIKKAFKSTSVYLESIDSRYMSFKTLPPPQNFYNNSIKGQDIISATINNIKYPILTQVIKGGNTNLHLNLSGLWKWEFSQNKNNTYYDNSFISTLLDHLKDNAIKTDFKKPIIVHSQLSEHPFKDVFNIYHPFQKPSLKDSLFLYTVDSKRHKKLIRQKSLNLLLESDTLLTNRTISDSTTYMFQIRYNNDTYEITKTIQRQKLNLESSSNDQNTLFLNKHFQELDLNNKEQLNQIFNPDKDSSVKETITNIYRIKRNWLILLLTILIISIFWSIKEE